jgi:hypothetical protein
MRENKSLAVTVILAICLWTVLAAASCSAEEAQAWTQSFNLEECNFSSTGINRYFILKPGYRLTLQGMEDEGSIRLDITVLDQTRMIGKVETRVVEEKETANDELVEISRNFYAVCTQTNSVFYFGEETDIYKDGKIVDHSGSWRADSAGAKAGLMIPGMVLLGARYYQEVAPGLAMDRAEIVSMTDTLVTPAGTFENCLRTEETTPLEPKAKEYKYYAPGVGLIKDGDLLLTKHGFINR